TQHECGGGESPEPGQSPERLPDCQGVWSASRDRWMANGRSRLVSPPKACERPPGRTEWLIMEQSIGVTGNCLSCHWVETQVNTGGRGLVDHPPQGDIGERRFGIRSAHITVT